MAKKKKKEEEEQPQSFEESMKKLEEIVSELERGELSLDESLKRYEQGVLTLRKCEAFLQKAEQKIQVLLKNEEGELEEKPFEHENAEQAAPSLESDGKIDPPASEEVPEDGLDSQIPF